MATSPTKRAVKTPGATTPEPVEQTAAEPTENTTGTVSEPVAEQEAVTPDVTTSNAPTGQIEPNEQVESTQTLPDDYEEYLAWKNSRTEEAKETTTTQVVTVPVVESEHVLTDKGWTKRGG